MSSMVAVLIYNPTSSAPGSLWELFWQVRWTFYRPTVSFFSSLPRVAPSGDSVELQFFTFTLKAKDTACYFTSSFAFIA